MPLHAQLHRRQFNGALEPGYPVSLSREMANGDKERKKQSGPRSSRGPRPPCSLAHAGAAARNYFLGSLELPESSLSRPLCRELRVLLSRDGSGGAGTLLPEAWGWGRGISQTPRGGGQRQLPEPGWVSASHPMKAGASGWGTVCDKVLQCPQMGNNPQTLPSRRGKRPQDQRRPGGGALPGRRARGTWQDTGEGLDSQSFEPPASAVSSFIHSCSRCLLGKPWDSARGVPSTGGDGCGGHMGRATSPGAGRARGRGSWLRGTAGEA